MPKKSTKSIKAIKPISLTVVESAVRPVNSKIILSGDLIKKTWSVYRDNWQKFVTLLIIPLIISAVLTMCMYLGRIFAADFNPALAVGWALLFFILFIANGILVLLAYIAQVLFVSDLKQPISFNNLADWYGKSWPYFGPAILVTIVFFAVSFFGLLVMIIPGIAIMVYYCFTIYELIVGGHGIEEAFGESRKLVCGRWWAVFGRLVLGCLLIWLAYIIVTVILALGAWLLNYFSPLKFNRELGSLLYNIFGIYIGLVVGPLSLIYVYNLYQSLLEIKSGK